LALMACATSVGAARRADEFLQAARIAIDPGRVRIELDLTPGAAVADAGIAEIDCDRTGTISQDEADAYAADVAHAIALEIDGTPLAVDVMSSRYPALAALKSGKAAIHLELSAALPALAAGSHHLLYRNTYRGDVSAYLASVLAPETDAVALLAQR